MSCSNKRRAAGNVRYALDNEGPYLIEEVRNGDGLTLGMAGDLFFGLLPDGIDQEADVPSEEDIEAALDGSGCPWSRRASCWTVNVTDRQPREVLVRAVPGGVRVTTVLTDWDEIAPNCAETLAQFLTGAQGGLRFARCELNERQAIVAGFAATETVDVDLAHALSGVAAGCELLAREAAALLRPKVAEIYRNIRRMPLRTTKATHSDVPAAAGRGKDSDPSEMKKGGDRQWLRWLKRSI